MFSGMRYFATQLAGGFYLLGALCLGGFASAETPASTTNTPALQSLMSSPEMQKATAAVRRGDFRSAAPYFLDAAEHGNPLAQVAIGRMYFEGRGVPRNNLEALKWLKLVMDRNQEPTLSLAAGTLKDMSTASAHSTNQEDKMAGAAARLAPILADPYVRQFLRNYRDNMAHARIVTCVGMVCM